MIAISNKFGDTPLSKARSRLRKKLETLASEYGQSLVIVPHKSEYHTHIPVVMLIESYFFLAGGRIQRKNDCMLYTLT